MKIPETLYCISFEDFSPDGAMAAELLSALELEFSTWIDKENPRVIQTAYFLSEEERNSQIEPLKRALVEWEEYGVKVGNFDTFQIAGVDWSEAWKKYFHPIEISPTLLIKPSWIDETPKAGQKVLTIDPGMSFGTGQHATTLFCLQCIDKLSNKVNSMLDAGCGSGILAIAGKICGIEKVDAFDFDPDAVRVAKENLALNGIYDLTPTVGDAANYQGRVEKYDLVCANILAHLLNAFRNNITSWVKEGGYLVLAGILATEFHVIVVAYSALGFELVESATLKEWQSGLFIYHGKN